jgi:topoisomerase-4 subunit A
MIYADGKTGIAMAKRFNVTGITRDKEYDLTKGNAASKVLWFTANPNAEAEVVTIHLNPASSARNKEFNYSFADLEIKARGAGGNQVTKYPVKSVKLKEKGVSTLSAPKIFFDEEIGRLNKDGYGRLLGRFGEEDRIIAFYEDGTYELTVPDLSNRYNVEKLKLIAHFDPEKVVSAIYFDEKTGQYNVKRFRVETQTLNNRFQFIREGAGNFLDFVTLHQEPIVKLDYGKKHEAEEVAIADYVDVTGWKTVGTRIATADLKDVVMLSEEDEAAQAGEAPTLF